MPAAMNVCGDTPDGVPLRFRIGSRCLGMLLLILLASTIGCHRSTPQDDTGRLVDPAYRAGMVADFGQGPGPLSMSPLATRTLTFGYPSAQLEDDTRLVLAAPAGGALIMRPHFEVSSTGAFHETVPAGGPFAGSSRLLLMPRVKLGSDMDRPPHSYRRRGRPGRPPEVAVDLQLPEAMAGKQVFLLVMAMAVDWGPEISLQTSPLEIPKNSRLELATGVLAPAWGQGPVRFLVEACQDHACKPLYETRMDPAQAADRGWRDASVALDPYAGKTVSLVFRSTLSPVSEEKISLPVWANPTIRIPRRADRSAPNVVLLSVDTLSARHLPTYGYFRDTAPVLAKEFEHGGTVFDNCVAAATSTPQAHMSIFTGLQPLEHGITAGVEVLDPAILTVTEQVRAAGVTTGAITEDGWLGAERGFGRGFDEYKENKSPNIMAPSGQVDKTFAAAKAWLERHADQRFFLFLHTFQVHDPYAPPPRYASLFPTDEHGDAIGIDAPSQVREARSYDQEIRYVDDELGSLLATIDGLGLSENTVFIVLSDHGEAFLEHGFLRHSSFFFEEVTHVPLLMRGPGIPRGLRVAAPVGHVDLTDTIASFFGVDPPRGSRGVDLRRAFRDGDSAADGAFYFSESWGSLAIGPEGKLMKFFAPAFSVRQGQRKAARYKREDGSRWSECYDLTKDPGERTNLCAGKTPEPADLAAALDAYQATTARRRAQLIPADRAHAEAPTKAPMDPEQEEKLRALGYIQ